MVISVLIYDRNFSKRYRDILYSAISYINADDNFDI